MKQPESEAAMLQHMARYRAMSYGALCELIDSPQHFVHKDTSGQEYQVEVEMFWDGAPHGPVRVVCMISSGGWDNFFPKHGAFVMAPDGRFVDE